MSSTTEDELREIVHELTGELERIGTAPLVPGTALAIKDDRILVATSSGRLTIGMPQKAKIEAGHSLLLSGESRQYVSHSGFAQGSNVAHVADIVDGHPVIEVAQQQRIVFSLLPVKIGDRVLLDDFSSFIVSVLPEDERFAAPETGVSWDDIGGNVEAKQSLIEAIEDPYNHPELYQHYGAEAAKGILLYGPPGCGKTMLGKAAATSIGAHDGFILCKGPEVLNEYVGVSERTVRGLFDRARAFNEKTGKKAVIFIDEAEALLSARGGHQAMMAKTIVPTFLAEMDGVVKSGATVILATNRSMDLDPAVVRAGRVDRKIEVARPNSEDSFDIMMTHLKKVPIQGEHEVLAEGTVMSLFARTYFDGTQEKPVSETVSGALLAGVVDLAKTMAIRRDKKESTRTGIGPIDLENAVTMTVKELGATAHEVVN